MIIALSLSHEVLEEAVYVPFNLGDLLLPVLRVGLVRANLIRVIFQVLLIVSAPTCVELLLLEEELEILVDLLSQIEQRLVRQSAILGAFNVEDRDILDLLARHRLLVHVRLRLVWVGLFIRTFGSARLPLFWVI